MFENYQFEGVYIAIQAVLTLYAQGEKIVIIAQVDLDWYLCTCSCST